MSVITLSISVLGLLGAYRQSVAAGTPLRVNEARLVARVAELAKFGRDDRGHGYRVAYTKGDLDGRAWFIEQMKRAGLDPAIDAAGNIIGKRKGKNPALKPIAFG